MYSRGCTSSCRASIQGGFQHSSLVGQIFNLSFEPSEKLRENMPIFQLFLIFSSGGSEEISLEVARKDRLLHPTEDTTVYNGFSGGAAFLRPPWPIIQ
jgi:hypothetical protein